MTSPRPRATTATTQGPIAASSLRHGMMADTVDRSNCRSVRSSGGMTLQAPAQAAACACPWWCVGLQCQTEIPICFTVPDVPQGLLRCIAKGVIFVALLGERRDAAGQGAAVGGEIHDGPRPAAQRPRVLVGLALEAFAGFGGT